MAAKQDPDEMPIIHTTQGWHLNKSISITHIFTTLTAVIMVLAFGLRLENRVEINAVGVQNNKSYIARVETDETEQYKEIIRRLERISDKIDNKADK